MDVIKFSVTFFTEKLKTRHLNMLSFKPIYTTFHCYLFNKLIRYGN